MDYSLIPAIISFIIIIGYGLVRFLIFRSEKQSETQIFQVTIPFHEITHKIKEFILTAEFPFAFDVAVEHLGTDPDVYVTVNDKNIRIARKRLHSLFGENNIVESDGYMVIYHAGEYDAFHAEVPKDEFKTVDLSRLNFSEVNEIGEGLVFRFHNGKDAGVIGIDSVFSAPSQFQLREIRDSAGEMFRGYGYGRPKDVPKFVSDFNYHDLLRD